MMNLMDQQFQELRINKLRDGPIDGRVLRLRLPWLLTQSISAPLLDLWS